MLLDYFNLAEEPFGVTPDPRFLFLGKQHREAMASLAYGTQSNRGFVALIAKPGMGKTSLLFHYLNSLSDKTRTAFVFRADCNPREFIRYVLLDLGINHTEKDLPAMHEALNQVLVKEAQAGNRFILVIDEAQNLDERVLESIRLLSNFETPWMKLMQIVIAGQPGLAEKLSRPSMAQLRQRISLVIRVAPLNRAEVDSYIDHRLSVAGCKDPTLFTPGARSLIAEHSEGIPRKINNICFNAMSLACALKKKTIERATVLEVFADLDLDSLIEKPSTVTEAREEVAIEVAPKWQPLVKGKTLWPLVSGVAIASALVLALVTGVNKGEVRAADTAKLIGTRSVEQATVPVQSSRKPEFNDSSTTQPPELVRISQGQTLYHVTVEDLGRYDPQILAEIRTLNPWLSDPAHIQAGQQILMPGVPKASLDRRDPPRESPLTPQKVQK
jgi:type II secretory pathway predicted ATPase ExeA